MATSAVPSLPPLRSPARGTASSASEDRASSPDDVAAAPLTETVAKRQGGMHMFGVKDSQRGLAGVGYVEYRAMYSTPHRGLRPGDIGWVPPSFDYRSLSPTKGRVNGMATSAVEHQRQNLFTVLPGHHWRAHEKLTQELAVLAKIPKRTRQAALDALATAGRGARHESTVSKRSSTASQLRQ